MFSIDDAFASDDEDTIRTYGAVADSRMSPFKPKTRPGSGRQSALQLPTVVVDKSSAASGSGNISVPTDNRIASEALLREDEDDYGDDNSVHDSIGSVSLSKLRGLTTMIRLPADPYADSLADGSTSLKSFPNSKSWWKHPKVRENWKLVLASMTLVLIGIGLIAGGICVYVIPIANVEQMVFYIAGVICFIPGAYHVVYIYLAVRGRQGFSFYNLPLVK